jgi:polyribonucleotide nucleotidyltransferase
MCLYELDRLLFTVITILQGVLMIEGACDFLTESEMVAAISTGHAAVRDICNGLEAWAKAVGTPKQTDTLRVPTAELKAAIAAMATDGMDAGTYFIYLLQ